MKFIIKKSKDGQFYFVLKARNGEPMFTSETYTRKRSCFRAIERLINGVISAKTKDETI